MPRIVYLGLFIVVAAIPFIFFAGLSSQPTGAAHYNDPYYRGSHYRRGPSFFFYNSGGSHYRRGRSYSSGGYKGGGFRSGK